MTSLFVDRRNTHLELDAGAIVFRENGERIGTVPIAPLTRVFLRGDVQLPVSLLGTLGKNGVGVVILSGRQNRPTLLLARPHNDARKRVKQIKKSLDEVFCLNFAKQLVRKKIKQQAEWFDELRQSDIHIRFELTKAKSRLLNQLQRVDEIDELARLRGVEGAAARFYFNGLRSVVPASMNFKGRNRRPPRDPFNALLSLSYTLIHAEIAISLYGAGLDPYVGFYHQLDFSRESLASDILEVIRPAVDKFCLHLVRQQTLRGDHFSTVKGGCLLGKAGRVIYYTAYEEHAEIFRYDIQERVEWLSEQIGTPIESTMPETD